MQAKKRKLQSVPDVILFVYVRGTSRRGKRQILEHIDVSILQLDCSRKLDLYNILWK